MTNLIPDAIDVVAVRAAAVATIRVTIAGSSFFQQAMTGCRS
jgi:hypothetical protein